MVINTLHSMITEHRTVSYALWINKNILFRFVTETERLIKSSNVMNSSIVFWLLLLS